MARPAIHLNGLATIEVPLSVVGVLDSRCRQAISHKIHLARPLSLLPPAATVQISLPRNLSSHQMQDQEGRISLRIASVVTMVILLRTHQLKRSDRTVAEEKEEKDALVITTAASAARARNARVKSAAAGAKMVAAVNPKM